MNAIHAIANRRLASDASKKLIYPAADRNKESILNVLKRIIHPGPRQMFLEIASGSGQHVAHFAPNFPQIIFYPSDHELRLIESIRSHVNGLTNIHDPLLIDVTTDCRLWYNDILRKASLDYIYCANMIHISPYECTIGLFNSAGYLLKPQGTLITYGPYAIDGELKPESNVSFDRGLKAQNPSWGVRDIRDLKTLASKNDIELVEIIEMPANNMTLIWKKHNLYPLE